MKALLLALAVLASPALAQQGQPLTGGEFDAYTRGKTLLYGTGGSEYGGEDYLPDHHVRWSFLDGDCLNGTWYQSGKLICFVYEDDPTPVCWTFFKGPGGLIAHLDGDQSQALYETGEAPAPLYCRGPKVGA